ncbi:hypothetical protein OS493_040486 [Desmophyllum pertusum]|uniref:Uncharacterized protein n=1 Tax=Desmophyllum pertusum TaxID=174260 RepID=A0A9W9ZGZ5_9CNID|nr:hypothetical protein OS493_040486 [Desmophyllum pertusum]
MDFCTQGTGPVNTWHSSPRASPSLVFETVVVVAEERPRIKPDNGVFYSFLCPGPLLYVQSVLLLGCRANVANLHAGNNTRTTPTVTVESFAC